MATPSVDGNPNHKEETMKVRNQGLMWAGALLLIGLFLLLKNLGYFGIWGEVAWGGIFAVIGLAFLVLFILQLQHWWRAIPGFTLLSIGALILLDWQKIGLGDWHNAVALFGVALGFWAALAAHPDNWWAAIPAGVLTTLGVLIGLGPRLDPAAWLAIFFAGLGLVFALLYLLRRGTGRWAAIPAAALILAGISNLTRVAIFANMGNVVRWWPVLLLAVAVGLLVGSIQRPIPAVTGPKAVAKKRPPIPAAKITPVTDAPATVTSVAEPDEAAPSPTVVGGPAPANGQPAESAADKDQPVDIYEFLSQQPPEDNTTPDENSNKT
jgi:hypothetical protein